MLDLYLATACFPHTVRSHSWRIRYRKGTSPYFAWIYFQRSFIKNVWCWRIFSYSVFPSLSFWSDFCYSHIKPVLYRTDLTSGWSDGQYHCNTLHWSLIDVLACVVGCLNYDLSPIRSLPNQNDTLHRGRVTSAHIDDLLVRSMDCGVRTLTSRSCRPSNLVHWSRKNVHRIQYRWKYTFCT